MARAIWSGSISFGLLNVPVKLYSAVSKQTVRFRELREGDGSRVKHKRVAESDGNGPVDAFVQAVREGMRVDIHVLNYHEHGVGAGEDPLDRLAQRLGRAVAGADRAGELADLLRQPPERGVGAALAVAGFVGPCHRLLESGEVHGAETSLRGLSTDR